ncbi:hypothetical protein NADE_001634 [Nannochloris sp. 'desiccata']|nr:hypothetical protein NADE_001634 [Chlorella desiccata (nom. nud.)]
MLGKIANLRDSVSQNVKDLAKDALSEAKDALREGQALARAAAKSREQSSQQDISWDVGGFSVADPGGIEGKFGQADAQAALNDASEIEEMLLQLKVASTSAADSVEGQEKHEEGRTDRLQEEPQEEDMKEENVVTKAGKKKGKKASAKKKAASTPKPSVDNPAPTTAPLATASTTLTAATDIEADPSLHILVPQLETRLHALQAKIVSMEGSRETLAASKAKSEDELRESRVTIELVTAERQKLASQVEVQQKKIAATEKLAKEKDAALKAEKLRVEELERKVIDSETVRASNKEQEDVETRWKAKVATLTSETEVLKNELETAVQATTEARKAQKTAETARVEAEKGESAAEQRAIAAINEAAHLRATSTQAQDQSEQLIRDNERRSKTFNAAVEVQVQRFRTILEEERDTALARVEEAHEDNRNLQQRVSEMTDALQKVKESSEEHAVAVMVEKNRVEEYEEVVGTMQGQVAAAVKASQNAETELKNRQAQWEEESESLKNKVAMLENELKIAVDKAQKAEFSVATLRTEAEQWRAAAQQVVEAQAAVSTARNDAEAATAEITALKIQLAHLQRELEDSKNANKYAGGSDFGTAPSIAAAAASALPPDVIGTPSEAKVEKGLPGASGSLKRESTRNGLSGFDLESLKRTPLLSGHSKTAGTGTEQRRSSLPFGSTKQVAWIYMALVHVLLLVAMGRASHAHLACEHLHLRAVEGGLP